jgi:hypothetical protein
MFVRIQYVYTQRNGKQIHESVPTFNLLHYDRYLIYHINVCAFRQFFFAFIHKTKKDTCFHFSSSWTCKQFVPICSSRCLTSYRPICQKRIIFYAEIRTVSSIVGCSTEHSASKAFALLFTVGLSQQPDDAQLQVPARLWIRISFFLDIKQR